MNGFGKRRSSARHRISQARKRKMRSSRKRDTLLQAYHPLLYFTGLVVYLELVFHIGQFSRITGNIIYPILLPLVLSAVFALATTFGSALVNKIVALVLTTVCCVLFCAEVVYRGVFQTYMAVFSIMNVANQALDFLGMVFGSIVENIVVLIFLLLPIVFYAVFVWRKMSFEPKEWLIRGFYVVIGVAAYFVGLIAVLLGGKKDYSAYDLYYHNVSVDMSIEQLGVLTTNRLDLKYFLFGYPKQDDTIDIGELVGGIPTNPAMPTMPSATEDSSEENHSSENQTNQGGEDPSAGDPTENPTEPPIDTSPNVLDIDFNALLATETNESIKTLHQYFAAQTPTNKNEYTGMFEGYNVIVICAEAFWGGVIDPERTPTLYRLANEGFVFENYYTPLWFGSTSGGEYALHTGTIPNAGSYVSMKQTGINGTNMYFTLGKQLSRKNYYTLAAHNNSATYYGRDLSMPNMGYQWFATGTGYEAELNKNGKAVWPQSDQQLISQTLDLYLEKEPFHVYYMTVSGHALYSFTGNSMSYRNRALVQDMIYSETTKAYIACQYELEWALANLVETLEEKGVADRTLIVLTGDHVPYNDKGVCDELAGHTLENYIEWYENTLIMWSGSMEEPIYVDKYCSSLDILPTVSNLLGLEYDSRMMVGHDILSDYPQFVVFNDRSFITEYCIYNAGSGTVTSFTGQPIDEAYLDSMKKYVKNQFTISNMIMESNYYSVIEQYLNRN